MLTRQMNRVQSVDDSINSLLGHFNDVLTTLLIILQLEAMDFLSFNSVNFEKATEDIERYTVDTDIATNKLAALSKKCSRA